MATAVAIMDRAGFGENADVIVVADPEAETLTWVPRDLWSERLGNRIARAYARGGHERSRTHSASTESGSNTPSASAGPPPRRGFQTSCC